MSIEPSMAPRMKFSSGDYLSKMVKNSECKGTTKIPTPQYSKLSVLPSGYAVFLMKCD